MSALHELHDVDDDDAELDEFLALHVPNAPRGEPPSPEPVKLPPFDPPKKSILHVVDTTTATHEMANDPVVFRGTLTTDMELIDSRAQLAEDGDAERAFFGDDEPLSAEPAKMPSMWKDPATGKWSASYLARELMLDVRALGADARELTTRALDGGLDLLDRLATKLEEPWTRSPQAIAGMVLVAGTALFGPMLIATSQSATPPANAIVVPVKATKKARAAEALVVSNKPASYGVLLDIAAPTVGEQKDVQVRRAVRSKRASRR